MTDTDKELLPCPFCGGSAEQENYVLEAAVFCKVCRATIKRSHTAKRDAGVALSAAAWNTRAAAIIAKESP